jgi:hypothetical protein
VRVGKKEMGTAILACLASAHHTRDHQGRQFPPRWAPPVRSVPRHLTLPSWSWSISAPSVAGRTGGMIPSLGFPWLPSLGGHVAAEWEALALGDFLGLQVASRSRSWVRGAQYGRAGVRERNRQSRLFPMRVRWQWHGSTNRHTQATLLSKANLISNLGRFVSTST